MPEGLPRQFQPEPVAANDNEAPKSEVVEVGQDTESGPTAEVVDFAEYRQLKEAAPAEVEERLGMSLAEFRELPWAARKDRLQPLLAEFNRRDEQGFSVDNGQRYVARLVATLRHEVHEEELANTKGFAGQYAKLVNYAA